jgi:hypothetical protein
MKAVKSGELDIQIEDITEKRAAGFRIRHKPGKPKDPRLSAASA